MEIQSSVHPQIIKKGVVKLKTDSMTPAELNEVFNEEKIAPKDKKIAVKFDQPLKSKMKNSSKFDEKADKGTKSVRFTDDSPSHTLPTLKPKVASEKPQLEIKSLFSMYIVFKAVHRQKSNWQVRRSRL